MVINGIPGNINQFLNQSFDAASEVPMLGWVLADQVQTIGNHQYKNLIHEKILNLKALGVQKGNKVIILGENSPDWHLWDMAVMAMGAISVPLLTTLSGNDLNLIINQIRPSLILIDNLNHYQNIQKISQQDCLYLFFIDEQPENSINAANIFYTSTMTINNKESISEEVINSTLDTDIATIVYTSGTTGDPRGAVITHGALIQMLHNIKSTLKSHLSSNDCSLLVLPLSHILGRCNSLLGLLLGIKIVYSQGQDHLINEFKIVKPTIFIGVPRLFEKFQLKILQEFNKKSSIYRAYINWANECSNLYFSKIDLDRSPNTSEIFQRNIAYNSVFKNIYESFGGRIRFFVSGGAPLSKEVSRFLRNCNLVVLEGYGLTETIGACVMSPINKPIVGSVGIPIGDVKLKIDSDGEILIKTKALFTHYYEQNKDSSSYFNDDGWYRSGDIGHLNSAGHLIIVDRKKNLIVTSNGKNIAPQKVENFLRKSPLIQEVIVIGDNKPYLTCLILLHKEQCISLLKADRYMDLEGLSKSKKIQDAIAEHIDTTNQFLSKHEHVLNFYLLSEDISDNPYLMSQSLKIRRQHVFNSFKKEIDAMYKTDQTLT